MKYIVINECENFMEAVFVTDNFAEAVGWVEIQIADEIDRINDWNKSNPETPEGEIKKVSRFYKMEGDTGYGWQLNHENYHENYYILLYEDKNK